MSLRQVQDERRTWGRGEGFEAPTTQRNGTRSAPVEVAEALRACARRAFDGRSARNGQVWRRRHVLDLDDFSPWEIEQVLETARVVKQALARPVQRIPALQGHLVATVFYEASTRTRVSFEVAARTLGADTASLSASASSITKGESLLDTLRTIEAIGATVVVLRHQEAGAPYAVADRVRARVINAGDGWHAHPTQALLDLFTIRERLGRLAGLRVAIVGDILHSRVARSNLWGLTRMGAEVVLCGPPTLLPRIAKDGRLAPWNARVEYRLEAALEGADVVMALRLQRERQEAGLLPSVREYVALYGLTPERLRLARPGALVMHPGPVNEGVELPPEVAHGPQSVIETQVANGVAVRMAVLYLLGLSDE
ncbi:MAG: aspartate carbamoyltransferase catalytic subunit [Chloroflexi bacterium]|nr:aspartate carbamoyltransferase catalytic subunit [Chloroflexota bacterium]